ncbi:MAG: hypothetical protein J6R99_03250, partial [Alphaproteobacteria bacterium]|nr:hypothetical protein [Alphaproteobacteria bacterium]
EELGYVILDNFEAYAKFGYTHDDDIGRKGMHLGRAGLKYRALDMNGFAWDLYADAQLGGISEMSGSYDVDGFTYDNYSNGRWGFHVGTQFGKQFDKFSVAAFAEVLRTFGNDNNSIEIKAVDASKLGAGVLDRSTLSMLGFDKEISVDLKSATEVNAGLKAFYQLNDKWSFGANFTFKHHSDNGVDGLASGLNAISTESATMAAIGGAMEMGLTQEQAVAAIKANPALVAQAADKLVANQQMVKNGLLKVVEDMEDGFDEYVLGLSAGYQVNDATQVVVYGEYTFDEAHAQSQNGTDVKAELGVRLNVQF